MLPLVALFIQFILRHDFIQRICTVLQFHFFDDDIKKKSIDNKKGGSGMFKAGVMTPRLATLYCFKFPSKTNFHPKKV